MDIRTSTNPWIMVGLLNSNPALNESRQNWRAMTKFIEDRYNISWQSVISKNRYAGLVYIRQLACYWFLNRYGDSKGVGLTWIGNRMGTRDHTTSIHSRETFKQRLDNNEMVPHQNIRIPAGYIVTFKVDTVREDYEQFKRQIILWL